jgi:glucokinase
MTNDSFIGIDLGGTNVRGALVTDFKIKNIYSKKINAQGTAEEVLAELFSLIDLSFND